MKKQIIVSLILLASIVIISYIFKLNFIYILIITTLCIMSYYFLTTYFHRHEDEKFIEEKLLIANKEIIKAPNTLILIVRDQKIIWCNDLCYSEFPILKDTRNVKDFPFKTKVTPFHFNDHVYEFQENDGLYFIKNITNEYNTLNHLRNMQTNIAILNIDNFHYLEEQLPREDFGKITRDLRIDLLKYFDAHNIFYQENNGDRYQLIIPEEELSIMIKNRFNDLYDIFEKYQTQSFTVSYSLGVALNQDSIRQTGYRAMEALELAISRGGAQTVIFDDEKRIIFGGGADVIHGSTLMKARLMSQTLLNIVKSKKHVFLMGHRNPDCDCIGAMLLSYRLIRYKYDTNITIIIDDENARLINDLLDSPTNLNFQSSIDERVENSLLIVVDTQSRNYVFDTKALDNISDIVLIDHHQAPDDVITNPVTKWVEPGLSSSVEMFLQMLAIAQVKLNNKKLSTYVLYAMLVDTNFLTYRVNDTTFDMIKRLVNDGGNLVQARRMTFDSYHDFKQLNQLAGQVFVDNACSIVETKNIDNHVLLSRVANKILEIEGVQVSMVCSIVDENYIVKLRSMGNVNVKMIIEEFGGGGHAMQAAGILTNHQYSKLKEKIHNFKYKE